MEASPPLLILQAAGRSSCSFTHLFSLSPLSHQLLRINSSLVLQAVHWKSEVKPQLLLSVPSAA